MTLTPDLIMALAALAIVALAADKVGAFFGRLRLPLITGFLFTGVLAGPHGLDLIRSSAIGHLHVVSETTIAFIAFAAGSELDLGDLKHRLRSIRWVSTGLVVVTFSSTVVATLLVADALPFARALPATERWAVALLAGAVLVARSPSSAIAVVNELRARGPFTGMVLGVTVVMDAVVIVLFAASSSMADALLAGQAFDLQVPLLVLGEIVVSLGLGFLLGKVLPSLVGGSRHQTVRAGLLLATGLLNFSGADLVRTLSRARLSVDILIEPLLVCMVAAFVSTNFTSHTGRVREVVESAGPTVYVVFFTLAGASLDIGVLAGTWQVALILFGVRLASIVVGSAVGGMLAGDPAGFNRVGWMSFVTQAGIGLGLAEEIAGEFPTWGGSLSAVIVAIIVMNQVVGPPLFKWALHLVGEARSVDDVARDRDLSRAVIVGWDAQAIAVARQLTVHGWEVAVASRKVNAEEAVPGSPATLTPLSDLTTEGLRAAGADRADTLVGLLTDEENTHLVEMARASFPSAHLVVQIHDRDRAATLAGDGVVVIDPETAIVNLLDHLVRTPAATSLLLGEDPGQDVTDLQVGNVALRGVAVRDLHLPLDIRVLSIQRRGARLISHGHTRLAVGDQVTVVGSAASLREVAFLFES